MRNEELSSGYAKELRRVEPDVRVRIFDFLPGNIPILNAWLRQMESASPAVSILFPVTRNGGSRSEANLELRDVLAKHHLQYGFRVVNFVICPPEALEEPIEEWKREFAEFAEWSWEIKDSVGTMGLWPYRFGRYIDIYPRHEAQGVVDEQRKTGLVIPASTVAATLAFAVAAPEVAIPLAVVAAPFAGFAAAVFFLSRRWRRDEPYEDSGEASEGSEAISGRALGKRSTSTLEVVPMSPQLIRHAAKSSQEKQNSTFPYFHSTFASHVSLV